jgi:hypothetical protein
LFASGRSNTGGFAYRIIDTNRFHPDGSAFQRECKINASLTVGLTPMILKATAEKHIVLSISILYLFLWLQLSGPRSGHTQS